MNAGWIDMSTVREGCDLYSCLVGGVRSEKVGDVRCCWDVIAHCVLIAACVWLM